jgi:uncharacterized protein (DUF1499 family)
MEYIKDNMRFSMHCQRCHHTDQVHKKSNQSTSLMRLGACQIPNCVCKQYVDGIKKIDEELL